MVSKLVTIVNETGIHARPATELSKFCSGFNEKITFICDGNGVDPKSIILLLAAGIKKGKEIEVQVEGENEEKVCDEIISFITSLNG